MAVNTVGTGGDYSTIASWEAALPSALTEVEVAELVNESQSAGSSFTINVTTSATNYIEIRPVSGGEWYLGGSAELTSTQGGSWGVISFAGQTCHVYLKGFRIASSTSSQNALRHHGITTSVPGDAFVILRDMFTACAGTGTSQFMAWGSSTYIRPTTSYNCVGMDNLGRLGLSSNYALLAAVNCTLVRSFTDAANATGNRYGTFTRCASFHYGPTSGYGDYVSGALNNTLTDCASHDATADLLDNVVFADQYTDPASGNWTFLAGNALEGAASGGADIGFVLTACENYGGGGSIIPRIMHQRRMMAA